MAEDQIVDPTVNPQAQRPGNVRPERTPGSAPSVVPLPDGADPTARDGEHPLPEESIDGYPKVAAAANSGDPVAYAEAGAAVATEGQKPPAAAERKPAAAAGEKPAAKPGPPTNQEARPRQRSS